MIAEAQRDFLVSAVSLRDTLCRIRSTLVRRLVQLDHLPAPSIVSAMVYMLDTSPTASLSLRP